MIEPQALPVQMDNIGAMGTGFPHLSPWFEGLLNFRGSGPSGRDWGQSLLCTAHQRVVNDAAGARWTQLL